MESPEDSYRLERNNPALRSLVAAIDLLGNFWVNAHLLPPSPIFFVRGTDKIFRQPLDDCWSTQLSTQ